MKVWCRLIVIVSLLALTGCQSVSVKKSLLVTGESVRSAMNVYGGLYRAQVLTESEVQQVRKAHDIDYLPAYNQAVALAQSDLSQMTPDEVAKLAADVLALVYKLKAAHED